MMMLMLMMLVMVVKLLLLVLLVLVLLVLVLLLLLLLLLLLFFYAIVGPAHIKACLACRVRAARVVGRSCVVTRAWRRSDLNSLCPTSVCPWLALLFDQVLDNNAWLSTAVQESLSFAAYWVRAGGRECVGRCGPVFAAGVPRGGSHRARRSTIRSTSRRLPI